MAFALLGKILDIEWILRRDEESAGDLSVHDRAALDRAALERAAPGSLEEALDAWLAARRTQLGGRTLGTRARELLTVLHLGLLALSLAAGAGTGKALLHGPSTQEPTNVLTFLFATLIWPLALLVGSVCLLVARGRLGRSVLLEDLYLAGVGVLGRLTRPTSGADAREEVARQWRALRRSGRRYRDLEVGTLLSAAQWYPLGFHLGAALALAASALASDLAFAWSTTNDSLSPSTLAAVFRVATAPWCGSLGVGCVSPELVSATQFNHFSGRFSLPHGAALSGAWWSALLGCLLTYGVLPRLVLSLSLAALVRRRSARLGERVLELRGRLHGAAPRTIGASPEPSAPAAAAAAATPVRPPVALGEALPCWVVAWRGATLEEASLGAVCARLGLRVERRDTAGDGDHDHDEMLATTGGSGQSAVLLLADGWEAPDKATRRFVQALRLRRERPVFVGVLIETENAPALDIWRDRLGLLEDPGSSVEAIVTGRSRAVPT